MCARKISSKISRPRKDLVKKFSSIPTPFISDVLGGFGAMISEIKPVVPNAKVCGPALTARTAGGAWPAIVRAIEVAEHGDVLVVEGRGLENVACLGGMICWDLKQQGVTGAVVDGAVRDIDELRELRFPIFARAIVPCVGPDAPAGDVNITIQCGGQKVAPDDIIVGDDNGVMVVPKEKAEEVLHYAEKKIDYEQKLRNEAKMKRKLLIDVGNWSKVWYEKRKNAEHNRQSWTSTK